MGEISLQRLYLKRMTRVTTVMVVAWSGAFAGSSAASERSSGDCIAEADFRQGSTVETQARVSNAPGMIGHTKTETLERRSFADANPLVQAQTTLIDNAPFFTGYSFVDLMDGKIIRYGNNTAAVPHWSPRTISRHRLYRSISSRDRQSRSVTSAKPSPPARAQRPKSPRNIPTSVERPSPLHWALSIRASSPTRFPLGAHPVGMGKIWLSSRAGSHPKGLIKAAS